MAKGTYQIFGRVISRMSRAGIDGVVVEAWDRDKRYHDMLGSTVTDQDGIFRIGFDVEYFRDDEDEEQAPDLFFRVYRDDELLKDTIDDTLEDQQEGRIEVVIELDLDTGTEHGPARGKDRLTSMQALTVARFVTESDFKGIYQERRDTATMVGRLLRAAATNSLAEFALEPVAPEGTRNREVVGQSVQSAQGSLARSGAEVVAVRAYHPRLDSDTADALGSVPISIHQGDRVTLYEEDGVVRYYAVERRQRSTPANTDDIVRIDGEVADLKKRAAELAQVRDEVSGIKGSGEQARAQIEQQQAAVADQSAELVKLRAELVRLREASSGKDQQIERLATALDAMRGAQDNLLKRLTPDLLARLERLGETTPRDRPVQ